MGFQKGHKLATGRPGGSKNKRTLIVETIAQTMKVDPFQILMYMAAGDWKALGYDNECYVMENAQGSTKIGYTITPEMRLSAAKEAAQYLYCKKKEETGEEDPIDITPGSELEAAKEAIEFIKKKYPKLLEK